jgi:arsenite methyltransferase
MAELTELTTTDDASASCCSAEAQATCCEPTDKAACCGESASGGTCGCSAGDDGLARLRQPDRGRRARGG